MIGKYWFALSKVSLSVLLIFVCIYASNGQDSLSIIANQEQFISPVDHTLRLAGSFGELRANHFHAGIDIKSKRGEEGDTIRATLSGYVSRIKVQRGGYGQVLYIDHPNGYTSVYAHLREYAPKLQQFIEDWQYTNKSYEIDIYPEAEKFRFTQGELIGLMGNTGRSYGPHLHFEIRKTDTEVPENPYLHGIGPGDKKAPLLYSIEAHGLDNEHHKVWSKTQMINSKNQNSPATFVVPAWRAGFAIQTFDLMDGASNKNGIYSIEMKVDDSTYFKHVMDRVGFDISKYINSHIDYSEKKTNNRTLTKCYVAPGNKLTFYPILKNNGEITLYKDKVQKVDFIIKDFFENETKYTCFIKRRDAKEGELKTHTFQKYIKQSVATKVNLGSCRFSFPANSFDKNTYLNYKETMENGKVAFSLNEVNEPIFAYPGVSLPITGITDTSLYDKVILVHENKTSYGGHIENDSLRVRIGSFGEYSIVIDTIPPKLDVGSFLRNAVGKPFFRFAISDNYDVRGYASELKYDVFIDGEWVIASLKAIGNVLIVPLTEVESGDHVLKIRLQDDRGNVTVWERNFRN